MKRLSLFFSAFFLTMQFSLGQPIALAQPMMVEDTASAKIVRDFVIVSPKPGTWVNKQPLVLEVPESCEVFYSFSGSHPMESGFAYDGPVMLEAEGDVFLRVALVFPQGDAMIYTIDYSVQSQKGDADLSLDVNFSQPLALYSMGQQIVIPEGYSYRLGDSPLFLPGKQVLSLEGGTFPQRFVPCHVTDGVNSWRFVISPSGIAAAGNTAGDIVPPPSPKEEAASAKTEGNPVPAVDVSATTAVSTGEVKVEYYSPAAGALPPVDTGSYLTHQQEASPEPVLDYSQPPFQISDWGTLTFTRNKLIYSMDDSIWQEATGSVLLDRSVGHTIYWQSVAYEQGNPVYSMYLPPRPSGQLVFHGCEAIDISLGKDFTLTPTGSGQTPLSSIRIDAFYGEEFSGTFPVDVYYQGMYQGDAQVMVSIDKCPPEAPAINADSKLFYNRKEVHLTLDQKDDSRVFYSLEMLVSEESGFKDLALNLSDTLPLMDSSVAGADFQPYNGQPIRLEPHLNHAHLFQVRAYSEDQNGNRSQMVSYQTIVDPLNFYVEANSDEPAGSMTSDGSLARPFVSVQQALEQTADLDFVRIHLLGMVPVDDVLSIPSSCEIIGNDAGSGLTMLPGGRLVARNGQVVIKDCVLEKQSTDGSDMPGGHPLLSVLNGSLSLFNCEVLGDFSSNGTLISAVDSTVSIFDSGITIQSGGYGALMSGLRSYVVVDGGRLTVVAPTAVVFSLSAGGFQLSDSQCRIFGNLGRVAELTGVGYSLINNEFHGVFKGRSAVAAQLVPVWKDVRSKQIESRDNIISGFPGS